MLKINHIAIVVSDLEEAQNFWVQALGMPLQRVEQVESEAVKVAFLAAGEAEIELLQPTDEESGVARYLQKRGGGLHHVCLEVADITATLERLLAYEIELINEMPRCNEQGRQYAFIHPRSTGGVLVELYQTNR